MAVNTAAETLLGGLAVKAIAGEKDEGPLVEMVAAVGATVVDVVELVVKELGTHGPFERAFAAVAAFVHIDVLRWSNMASSVVHD